VGCDTALATVGVATKQPSRRNGLKLAMCSGSLGVRGGESLPVS
jgi:hypothetical protein